MNNNFNEQNNQRKNNNLPANSTATNFNNGIQQIANNNVNQSNNQPFMNNNFNNNTMYNNIPNNTGQTNINDNQPFMSNNFNNNMVYNNIPNNINQTNANNNQPFMSNKFNNNTMYNNTPNNIDQANVNNNQPINQNSITGMNSNQPNIDRNIPNKANKKKNFIPIIIAGIAIVILVSIISLLKNNNEAENLGNLNSTANPDNNINSNTPDISTNEEESSTPNNSTINQGDTIRIREVESLNIDLKYISYDSSIYDSVKNRNVAFKFEITNKSKKKKHLASADINIYDSSDKKISGCQPKTSTDPVTGELISFIESEKTETIYYVCYIPSTSEPSQITKAMYEKAFLITLTEEGKVQYNLKIN